MIVVVVITKTTGEKKLNNMNNYLNIEELAEYLHMSKSTIYKGTMSRTIPHIKAGKKLLFEKDAIDKWLQKYNQPTVEEVKADISSIFKMNQNEN